MATKIQNAPSPSAHAFVEPEQTSSLSTHTQSLGSSSESLSTINTAAPRKSVCARIRAFFSQSSEKKTKATLQKIENSEKVLGMLLFKYSLHLKKQQTLLAASQSSGRKLQRLNKQADKLKALYEKTKNQLDVSHLKLENLMQPQQSEVLSWWQEQDFTDISQAYECMDHLLRQSEGLQKKINACLDECQKIEENNRLCCWQKRRECKKRYQLIGHYQYRYEMLQAKQEKITESLPKLEIKEIEELLVKEQINNAKDQQGIKLQISDLEKIIKEKESLIAENNLRIEKLAQEDKADKEQLKQEIATEKAKQQKEEEEANQQRKMELQRLKERSVRIEQTPPSKEQIKARIQQKTKETKAKLEQEKAEKKALQDKVKADSEEFAKKQAEKAKQRQALWEKNIAQSKAKPRAERPDYLYSPIRYKAQEPTTPSPKKSDLSHIASLFDPKHRSSSAPSNAGIIASRKRPTVLSFWPTPETDTPRERGYSQYELETALTFLANRYNQTVLFDTPIHRRRRREEALSLAEIMRQCQLPLYSIKEKNLRSESRVLSILSRLDQQYPYLAQSTDVLGMEKSAVIFFENGQWQLYDSDSLPIMPVTDLEGNLTKSAIKRFVIKSSEFGDESGVESIVLVRINPNDIKIIVNKINQIRTSDS